MTSRELFAECTKLRRNVKNSLFALISKEEDEGQTFPIVIDDHQPIVVFLDEKEDPIEGRVGQIDNDGDVYICNHGWCPFDDIPDVNDQVFIIKAAEKSLHHQRLQNIEKLFVPCYYWRQ